MMRGGLLFLLVIGAPFSVSFLVGMKISCVLPFFILYFHSLGDLGRGY